MKILQLKLYTDKLEQEKKFYSETLGFKLLEETSNHFTVKTGWTELTFEQSKNSHLYHYCFLIPSNQLNQALEWIKKRVLIIDIENGRKIQNFETWNADSFYFYDASGNIAEFIVRHDLKNECNSDFNISNVLGINEIGLPTLDITKTNRLLQEQLGTKFWKGDLKRFGTNGSQEGLFLLPNYKIKETWFPTAFKIKPEPFQALIQNKGRKYYLDFKSETITTTINSIQKSFSTKYSY